MHPLHSAFIRMIDIFRVSSRAMAHWCGVVAASCRLVTLAPLRCVNPSFCCGSRYFVNTRSSCQISLSRAGSAGVSQRWQPISSRICVQFFCSTWAPSLR